MYWWLFNLLLLNVPFMLYAEIDDGHNSIIPAAPLSTNDLDLSFSHQVNKRENIVSIYFDVSNSTLKEYRYYYFDFRPFGSSSRSEYLPRQRLVDTRNSLRIVGLHDGDYVSCLSFVDDYEKVFKPRYACYEFTLGEKTVGSHHGGKSGYLAPLLITFAFILHVFIAIVHHIKAKNYPHKLLRRFIDVTPRSTRGRINISQSLRELDRELDYPHVSASVQRRLSRVTIDATDENTSNFLSNNPSDELPLYTISHHSGRYNSNSMQVIPEHENANTMDSVSSMRHLIDSAPWIKHGNRSASSSTRRKSPLNA